MNTELGNTGNTGDNNNQGSTPPIDYSSIKLPDDHPLVKAFNSTKQELSTFKTQQEQAKKDAEAKQLEEKNQWAALAQNEVEKTKSEYETQLEELRKANQALQKDLEDTRSLSVSYKSAIDNINRDKKLDELLKDNKFDFGDFRNYDAFERRYGSQFQLNKKGDLVAVKDGKELDPKEFIESIKSQESTKNFWQGVEAEGSNTPPESSTGSVKVITGNSTSKTITIPRSVMTRGDRVVLKTQYGVEPKDVTKGIENGSIKIDPNT